MNIRKEHPAVGAKLRPWLQFLLVGFVLLLINSLGLLAVTIAEAVTGQILEGPFYLFLFLVHVLLGLLLIVPLLVYGVAHALKARALSNRRAKQRGLLTLLSALILVATGIALTRGMPLLEVRDPLARDLLYGLHLLIVPLLIAAFVAHRRAGRRWDWGRARVPVAATGVLAVVMLTAGMFERGGTASGTIEFAPALTKLQHGDFLDSKLLMTDAYCAECHADVHARWEQSAHRLASFNNPFYRFSVAETRRKLLARDGDVTAGRFCGGCHDLVPMLAGMLDDPQFDFDSAEAQAGLTCVSCHAITSIDSPRGNADFTVEEPGYYPFTFSEQPFLAYLNRALVKAKPGFHKRSMLKPLHTSTEFCGSCHKVHLPVELNDYRWLRGQNHYDSFFLSGVSGHNPASFYYPEQAADDCNGCHMPHLASDDFGAFRGDDGALVVHDHRFAAANTALAVENGYDLDDFRRMLEGSVRLDIFGLRRGTDLRAPLVAPIGSVPAVVHPGEEVLLEIVIRTLRLGHHLTQGTADSNELWLEVEISDTNGPVAASGRLDPITGALEPVAHRVNAHVLDREGRRIDRRNAEDIFTALYNHQIPPGAADTVWYRLQVPEASEGSLRIKARLRYRKFDTNYVQLVENDPAAANELPIIDLATATARIPIGDDSAVQLSEPAVPEWQRWNDYGIGLLRKPEKAALRQAEHAFEQVASTRPDHGLVNLARVYLNEGRLGEAEQTLAEVVSVNMEYPWVAEFLIGDLNLQNGNLDAAAASYERLLATDYAEARARGFDFSKDYRLQEKLGLVRFEQARRARGQPELQQTLFAQARTELERVLELDPERASTHYALARVARELGDMDAAARHTELHRRYRVDDNARDRAIAAARRADPAADYMADPVVIYPLRR